MKIDQKLLRVMGMVAGGIIIFIVIIAVTSSCVKNKKYTLIDLENKLISLSKSYYDKNKEALPKEGESTSLTSSYFISNGNFKELRLKNGATCSGEISVTNNNGYYLYIPALNCGNDIKPITLTEKLKEDIVHEGEGLYENGPSYIFRGEVINNYLSIEDKLFRIIKINSDDSIRIIENKRTVTSPWDNRYSIERKTNVGINDYITNNINSRVKNKLDEIYDTPKLFSDSIKAYFNTHDVCVGKRSIEDTENNGAIECSVVIKDQVLGLIQVNEYMQATLDKNCLTTSSPSCSNYNYLARLDSATWTITADKDTSYRIYKLDRDISLTNASSISGLLPVVHLDKKVLYSSGDGSLNDPYIIK